MQHLRTLCLITEGDRVLLGMKKRGFGEGKWNGFGGKLEPGETIEQAAFRELQEEAGVSCARMTKVGVLDFTFMTGDAPFEVHVFHGHGLIGEPQETDEMRPQWFAKDEIPFDEMWADDRHWFPWFWEGRSFTGRFVFEDLATIVEHGLRQVPGFADVSDGVPV